MARRVGQLLYSLLDRLAVLYFHRIEVAISSDSQPCILQLSKQSKPIIVGSSGEYKQSLTRTVIALMTGAEIHPLPPSPRLPPSLQLAEWLLFESFHACTDTTLAIGTSEIPIPAKAFSNPISPGSSPSFSHLNRWAKG